MKRFYSFLVLLAIAGSIVSCKKDDPPAPDNFANFESATQGIDEATTEVSFAVKLSRAADKDVTVNVQLKDSGVVYSTHYTTTPAATNGTLTVTIPAGSTSTSFKLKKASDIFLSGSEYVNFTIQSASTPAKVGTTAVLKVLFSSIVSKGAANFQLSGIAGSEAGSSAANSVFVDFSNNKQTPVLRASWDLAFYNGNEFRVIINNTTGANAVKVNKTDINSVTLADIDLATTPLTFGQGEGDLSFVDDVTGDITKTVIGEVSGTDADNKVYIINRANGGGFGSLYAGTADSLIKIRVLKTTTGYTLQYASIKETSFKTINIAKNAAYNFQYVSINKGVEVTVQPEKDKWDIEWTYNTYKTALSADAYVPYAYPDFVLINDKGGVKAAQVLTTTKTYDAYAEADIATTTFSTDRNLIGSNWRSTGGPGGGATGAKTDRFYVIKDAAGNVYKLKFISMGAGDGGTRGKPVIEYALVKKS